MIRQHDQGNLYVKTFNLGLIVSRVRVLNYCGREHGSRQTDMVLETKLRVSLLNWQAAGGDYVTGLEHRRPKSPLSQ